MLTQPGLIFEQDSAWKNSKSNRNPMQGASTAESSVQHELLYLPLLMLYPSDFIIKSSFLDCTSNPLACELILIPFSLLSNVSKH